MARCLSHLKKFNFQYHISINPNLEISYDNHIILISSPDPFWIELVRCSFSAIDGASWTTILPFFLYRLQVQYRFKGPFLSTAHIFLKFDGVPLPSMHVPSFLTRLRFLYFELLKLVPFVYYFSFLDWLWKLYCGLLLSCVRPNSLVIFLCLLLSRHHSTPLTNLPFTNILLPI